MLQVDFRGALEIQDAEIGAQIPMGLGRERKLGQRAPAAHFDVVFRAPAGGHGSVRRIGNTGQQLAVLIVELFRAFFERGGAVAHFANLLLAFRSVLTRFDELTDLLRFGFTQSFELFRFRKRGAPLGIELTKSFDVERETAIRQPRGDGVEILPEERKIVHRERPLSFA